jgi:hypothetical protein
MSDERKPLLSEDERWGLCSDSTDLFAIDRTIAYFQRLIDEGKLRVVEEVEVVRKYIDSGGSYEECSGCGYIDLFHVHMIYCPGCGNKIKQP